MTESTFTIRVEDDLKAAFAEAAKAQDRTGAQLIRDFMRDFVQRTREQDSYEDWFRRKVGAGLADLRAGRVSPADEVEAYFASRRADLARRAGESDT